MGIASSSSISIPHLTHTYLESGNRGQNGKIRLEHWTLRTTPQKRISPTGNWCIPLRTSLWTHKSTHMHSWKTMLWKMNSQRRIQKQLKESKVVRTKFVFVMTWRKRRWCLAKNPAKLSSRWVTWNSLNWRIPGNQCPSCLHNVFKGSILCACGKHITPDQETIRRFKAAFEILRAPCFRASVLNSRSFKHGPDSWLEHHHKANDALHGCSKKKRQYTSIWDRWQNDKTYRESHFAIGWSDASVKYLDTLHKLISLTKRRKNNEVSQPALSTSRWRG